jgi:hypothetical protein
MTIAVPTSGFRTYKWIVSATPGFGTHTTIQSAITAATSGDTILVRDGLYVENFSIKSGISLVAASTDVTIQGKALYTDAGIATVSGFTLTNNADYVVEMTGANNSQLFIESCYFDQTNAGMFHQANSNASSAMWVLTGFMSQVANHNLFDFSGAGVLYLAGLNSTGPTVTTPSTISGSGIMDCYYCALSAPITISGTGNLVMKFTTNLPGIDANAFVFGGTGAGPNQLDHCYLGGQIVINNPNGMTLTQISQVSSQTNVITGTGLANLGMITFFGSGTGVNTSTINKLTTYGGTIV